MERVAIKVKDESGGAYFAAPKENIEFISTGCKMLDLALGGGWAESRIANIVGDKSSGKTLLCIEACANFAIKYPKGKIYYREAEAAFDEAYAQALGMPVERVDFGDGAPLETIEDLFEDLQAVVRKAKGPVLYIVDSLDALSDRAELNRDLDEGTYGAAKAKQLSQLFRRLVRRMESKQVTLLIVSQVRDKIGAMFGRKTTRSGGRALDFYASQVLYLSQLGKEHKTRKGVKRPIGLKIKAQCDKNKVSLPYREAEFKIIFGYGVDDIDASLQWLASIHRLGDVELSENDMQRLDRALNSRPGFERQLRKAVTKAWYEIERSFVPTKRKYG